MAYMIDFRVLELLCSRICHDLISPVTAINNGMELLDDDPGDMLDDIRDLLMNSASEVPENSSTSRLAYGMGGDPDGEVRDRRRGRPFGPAREARETLDRLARGSEPDAAPSCDQGRDEYGPDGARSVTAGR